MYDRTNIGAQTYTYNGLGDRVRVDKPTGTRRFVYDAPSALGGRVIAEYGASANDVKAEFIWALPPAANDNSPYGGGDHIGGYAPLALVAENPSNQMEVYWVHGNHLGVPVVTTNAQGQVVTPGTDFLRPGFPGQSEVLADLYYNRARDYDPVTGRYVQADPIGLMGDINPYVYAGSDPVNLIDPLGLFSLRDGAGFVPVLGSSLDAYDAINCGNYGWAAVHTGLALVDATGAGALAKGLLVGGFKLSQRAAVRSAYRKTSSWNSMRQGLQRRGVLVKNSGRWRPDWMTTHHVFISQSMGRKYNLPHWLVNNPANLKPNVTAEMNRRIEQMNPIQKMMQLPIWVGVTAGGVASSTAGTLVNGGTHCKCQ